MPYLLVRGSIPVCVWRGVHEVVLACGAEETSIRDEAGVERADADTAWLGVGVGLSLELELGVRVGAKAAVRARARARARIRVLPHLRPTGGWLPAQRGRYTALNRGRPWHRCTPWHLGMGDRARARVRGAEAYPDPKPN